MMAFFILDDTEDQLDPRVREAIQPFLDGERAEEES